MNWWSRLWAWVGRAIGRLPELIEEPGLEPRKLSHTRALGVIVTLNGLFVWNWLIFVRKEMVTFDATMAGIIIGFVLSSTAKHVMSGKGDTKVEISGKNPEVIIEKQGDTATETVHQ